MPYATRQMFNYMKNNGMCSADGNSPGAKKKIRELPNSVDPVAYGNSPIETPGSKNPKSLDFSSDNSKILSSVSCPSSKSNSNIAASMSRTGKHKSAQSHAFHSSKSPDKIQKPKTGQEMKRTSSGHSLKRNKSSESRGKTTRVIPATVLALKPLTVSGMDYDNLTFAQKEVKYIQELLKSNVTAYNELEASSPYEETKKEFDMYSVGEKKPLHHPVHSAQAIYVCNHKAFPKEMLLVCKLYDASNSAYNPKKSHFLKTLRHLGKKHPDVVQTWDVIYKDSSVYVFQEFAAHGNMVDYMAKHGFIKEEPKAQEIGRQLRTGIDFLGDMGVAHRSICPRHVLVMHQDLRVKLTGFRASKIYYDQKKDDIKYQPCFPLDKKKKEEDYNAPEVFGDPNTEHFDPVNADCWSFGATMYKFVSGKFPYDCSKHNPKIENEIQGNVRNLKLSDNGKSALGHMLTTVSTKRICINKLINHPWLMETM